ncbi:MAG: bifunctional UDP-sugar hydrolase/5'-nucleotidase [Acidobacteria bacterium]|nr:bifunctional UDP-sugar hydrolase/5'-nucleotidase [Acidobacteriota bacterium]
MRRRTVLAACLFALCLPAIALAQSTTARLTILHTNDTHGHLLPFSYPSIVPAGSELEQMTERSNIGGIARRAALAQKIRIEQKGRGIPVWLVDVGDFSDGTPFSTEYKGEADMAAMNASGYNFETFGNHEFNNKLEQVTKLLGQAKAPVLLANAIDRATQKPLGQVYRVEKIGGLRVGLFGLITHEAGTYPAAKEGIDVLDEIKTATGVVETLRKQADVVILLSHCGEDMDQRLAAEVPGIDVIVGGHSHTRLPVGEFVWHGDDLKDTDVNGTVIAQAHQWGGELGRLDLLFEKDAKGAWHVDRFRARLLPLTKDMPADPTVAAVVEKYWQPIAAAYGEVVGKAAGDFSSRGDDAAPYNLVADAIRESFGVEVEMENSGGVRAPLVTGDITRTDLVTMDPFDNKVMLFKATGRQIKDVLARYTPYVSGLRYRVVDGQLIEASVNGQPIDDDKTYTGATNSYFAGFALKGISQENTGRLRLDVLTEYIRKKGTVTPAYDGRRVVIGRSRSGG